MKLIPQELTQKIGHQVLSMQKNSPRTLFIVGIVGVVGSTILACRATLKLDETLTDFKNHVDEVKDSYAIIEHKQSPKRNKNQDLARVYGKGTVKIVRLYAPAVILGGLSIAALTHSHITLTRRNAALTAAYSALSASYDSYRERVRKEVGEEKELDIHHGVVTEKMAIDGKTQLIRSTDPNKLSPYARFFDEYNVNWEKNPEYNRLFITAQQNYVNHLLHARGHVFLNEVYDQLGIPRSQAGQVVGWVVNQGGDNFIDFGIFEVANSAFVNGWERSILLDFNVDGVVYDKI